MANPTITDYGLPTPNYSNGVHNWRAQDITFLSERSVTRYPSPAALTGSAHDQIGAVAYIANDADSDDTVEPGADPHFRGKVNSTTWKRFLQSTFLTVPDASDSATTVSLRHSSSGTGLTLRASPTPAVVVDQRFEVGSRAVIVDGALSLVTGGVTAVVAVVGSKLESTVPLKVPGIEISGTGVLSGGAAAAAHTLTGTLAITGNLSSTTQVSAPVVNSASFTGTNLLLSGTIDGGTVKTTGTGGVSLNTTKVTRSNLATLSIDLAGNDVTVDTPTSGLFKFRTATTQSYANVAGVVINTAAPSGSYPNGTIWLQIP